MLVRVGSRGSSARGQLGSSTYTSKVRVSSTGARAHKETRKKDTGDCERRAHKGVLAQRVSGHIVVR